MTELLDVSGGRVVDVAIFYKVSALLGTGRFSEVYKAFDARTQTDVALKIYIGSDAEAHTAAQREAESLKCLEALNSDFFPKLRRSVKQRICNLNHPILIMELGVYVGDDGHKRIVCLKDLVPEAGKDSEYKLSATSFWESSALVQWIVNLVQAVKQIHSIGLIHRDLKPANVLLKRGAGQSATLPLILDFNTSVCTERPSAARGTPRYLPPEVQAKKRIEPSIADDLWASALISWELLHGLGASPESGSLPHNLVSGEVPQAVCDVLTKALSIDPKSRFESAAELLEALEQARSSPANSDLLSTDEFSSARSAMSRIRNLMLQSLAPPGDVVVQKEVEETVTTAIALFSETETQSLDLVAELVRLGPSAIPVCLQQAYRLPPQSNAYAHVIEAITTLASTGRDIAERSINRSILSSNRGVRTAALDLSESISYFPEATLKSLSHDDGLFLPGELRRLASLCIRFSRKRTAALALEKYLFREFIIDRNSYRFLSDTVARKMHEFRLSETPGESEKTIALLVAEDTSSCAWRGLDEFGRLSDEEARSTEKGLVELMADAFAATGLGGLKILKDGKVARSAGPNDLPIFRRFATKLARTCPEAKAWLSAELAKCPWDRDLQAAVSIADDATRPLKLLRNYSKTTCAPATPCSTTGCAFGRVTQYCGNWASVSRGPRPQEN